MLHWSSSSTMLLVLSAAFALLGGGVLLVQRRAKSCPAHSRTAGRLAYVVAGFCFLCAGFLAIGMMALVTRSLP
ncbi:MAG: hypothetical protein ACOY3P_09790 [Planctomycetota bacterium]